MLRTEVKRCFILLSGEELIVNPDRGHNDVALEYIESKGYENDMRKMGVDPIKYMVFYLGAAKVGSNTEGKIIDICLPYSSEKLQEVVNGYKMIGYKVRPKRIREKW